MSLVGIYKSSLIKNELYFSKRLVINFLSSADFNYLLVEFENIESVIVQESVCPG